VTAAGVQGEDRERLWARQLERTPCFARFQERAGRLLPVVALNRTA
jgi:hypothetical protein